MALTGTDRGTGTHNTSSPTLAVVPASNFAAGSLAVLCLAIDNAGAAGVSSLGAITDSAGNTWTTRVNRVRTPGATANDGCVVVIATAPVGTLTTGTTITVNFGVAVVAKVWALHEVAASVGVAQYVAKEEQVGSGTGAFAGGSVNLATGAMFIGVGAQEQGTGQTITPDSDSTRGTWSTAVTGKIGSASTGMCLITQRKVVTAPGTQQFDPVYATSSDWAVAGLIVAESQFVTAVGAVATAGAQGNGKVGRSLSGAGGIASGEVFGGTPTTPPSETPVPDTHASGMANGLDASTLGNRFTAINPGSITHIRHWHTAGDGANTHYLQVYDAGGTKVAFVDDACGGAPTGWRTVALATPYPIAAGATFTVAIHTTGWYYTFYIAYPIASSAPSLTSAGSWNLYGLDGYPTAASGGTYLIDCVYAPTGVPGGPVVTQGAARYPVTAVGAIGTGYASGTAVVTRGVRAVSAVGAIGSAQAFGLPVVTSVGPTTPQSVSAVGGIDWAWRVPVSYVDPSGTGTVGVVGDYRSIFVYSIGFTIRGSTALNGSYTPSTSAYAAPTTFVVVYEDITTSVADGFVYVVSFPSVGLAVVQSAPGAGQITSVGAITSAAAVGVPSLKSVRVITAAGTNNFAVSPPDGVVQAPPLSQSLSAIGGIGTSASLGIGSVGRGGTIVTLTSLLSSFSMGGVSVSAGALAISGFTAGSVGFFGGATVVSLVQAITGSGLVHVEVFGVASLSLRINAVGFDASLNPGIGIVATKFKLNEVQSGHYEGSVSLYQIPDWVSQAGIGYALFVMGWQSVAAPGMLQPIDTHNIVWVLAGTPMTSGKVVVAMYRAVAPKDTTGYTLLRFSSAADELQWAIIALPGADTDGTNGAQLIAAGPDYGTSATSPVQFNRTVYDDVRDVSLQFMRSPGPFTPEVGASSSTEQVGPHNVTRAIWKQSEQLLSATTVTPGSDLAVFVNAEMAAVDVPTWVSGTGIPSAGALGSGSVANLVWIVSGSGADFSVPVAAGGAVGLRRVFGAGADFSSAVGAAGSVEQGKKLQTFTTSVVATTTFRTIPAGPRPLLFAPVVAPVASFVLHVHAVRVLVAVVAPRAKFAVVYKAKRAVARIGIAPVTAVSVVVGKRVDASTVVGAVVVASIVVVRNEDEVMSERNEFDIGDVARVTATITSGGVLKDPVSVAFQYRTPDGLVTGTSAVRVGVGVYYGDIPCAVPGRHWWRLSGSPDASFGEEGAIRVRRSAVLDT